MGLFSSNVSKQGNSSGGNQGGYINVSKLGDGESFKVAILSEEAEEFFEVWGETEDGQKKPFRFSAEPSQADIDATLGDYRQRMNYEGTKLEAPKFVVAFFVLDYADNKVKVMSIPQKTVYTELDRLSQDEDFGDLHAFDLKFSRQGLRMETQYRVTPLNRKADSDKLIAAGKKEIEDGNYELKELIVGGNPFGG